MVLWIVCVVLFEIACRECVVTSSKTGLIGVRYPCTVYAFLPQGYRENFHRCLTFDGTRRTGETPVVVGGW
jgi:hypothetical protein